MNKKDFYITVKIKTTNIEQSPTLEDYVTKKLNSLEKFLGHYQYKNHDLIFEVEIGKTTNHHRQGDIYRAEINFAAGGTHLRSEATRDDLYAAIDEAKDDLKREIRNHTKKHRNIFRRGKAKVKDLIKKLGRR